MHKFLENFHQGRKYSAQVASHQAELRREVNVQIKKSLDISSLQTDYLNLYSSSGFRRNSERSNNVHTKFTFLEVLITLQKTKSKRIRQEKGKSLPAGYSDNRQTP